MANGLINLQTDLKSLKYSSMPLGSDAPYVTKNIGQAPGSQVGLEIQSRIDDHTYHKNDGWNTNNANKLTGKFFSGFLLLLFFFHYITPINKTAATIAAANIQAPNIGFTCRVF